jgi:hypothetical protein
VFVAEGKPPDGLLPDQWALANPDRVLLNRDHENRQAQERKSKKRMARRTATVPNGHWGLVRLTDTFSRQSGAREKRLFYHLNICKLERLVQVSHFWS